MHSSKLPTELSLEILCASGSLKDAISLASASRQLRAIWIEHADTIYRAVAPRSIEGEKHARHLQLSISQHTKITSTDAAQIVQYADFMDSIIHQFTEKIVKRTPSFRDLCASDPYRGYGGRHPEFLTPPERRRFIRTYYQLWSLILLPEPQWPSTVASLTIKQVYLLREMCFIPLAIGPDPPSFKAESMWYRADGKPCRYPPFEAYSRDGRRGALGTLLDDRLCEHEQRMKTLDTGNVHWVDTDPWILREESRAEGFAGFHLIWDHAKDQIRQYALARPDSNNNGYRVPTEEEREYERRHQWVDSSDEEEGE